MLSLFSSLSMLLSDRGAAAALAPQVGGTEDEVGRAISPSLARLVDGLASLADAAGPESVAALVDRHDSPQADELDRHLAEGPTRPGHEILDRCFGAERGLVVIGLASALGLAPSLVGRLLPLLAPVVTAELARRWDASGTAEAGLAELLRREHRAIERAGLLEGTTFDDAGLDELLRTGEVEVDLRADDRVEGDAAGMAIDAGAGITRPGLASVVGAEADDGEVADGPGAVRTLDEDASSGEQVRRPLLTEDDGRAAIAASTGPAEVVVRLDDPQDPATDDDQGASSECSDEDGPGDPIVVDTEQEPTEVADRDDRPPVLVRSIDGRGAALAWLGWAVGAIVLVLLLASLLSTCSSSATSTPDEEERVVAVAPTGGDDAGADDPAGVPTGEEDGVDRIPAAPSLFDVVDATRPEPAPEPELDRELGTPSPDPTAPASASGPAAGTSLNELLELAPVTFDAGSADLTAEGRQVLDLVAGFLVDNAGAIVEIGGHTDSDGEEAANLELSQARADEVLRHLAGAGVERARLIAIGHGEASPVVPNDSLANKAINRRIEFIVR